MTAVKNNAQCRKTPGVRRLVVVGTTGSGKTTLARELSRILGVTHVELDAYRHGPNWRETPDDLFREQLADALRGDRWVADGNYSVARDVVWPRATALVWIDYPIRVPLWRLFWRTLRRGVTRQRLWNDNKENLFEHFFTTRSLFVWALKSHWRRRKTMPAVLGQAEYAHLEVIRLRSPSAVEEWLTGIRSAQSGAIHQRGYT